MSSSETVLVSNDNEDARFGRKSKTGVMLGLNKLELCVMIGAVTLGIILVIAFGPVGIGLGLILVAVSSVLCWVRAYSISYLRWIARLTRTVKDSVLRRDVYTKSHAEAADEGFAALATAGETDLENIEYGLDEKGLPLVGKPVRIQLPGQLGEERVYRLPTGATLTFNPASRLASVTCEVEAPVPFAFEPVSVQRERTETFEGLLKSLADIPGIVAVFMRDVTINTSGSDILRTVQHARGNQWTSPNEVASQAYEDLLATKSSISHRSLITLVLEPTGVKGQVKRQGGGVRGLMSVMMGIIDTVEDELTAGSLTVTSWLSPRQLGAVIRHAFDPQSSAQISDRTGDFAGVEVAGAGPMIMEPHWSHVDTDETSHQVLWVNEWPRRAVAPGFMEKLIFNGRTGANVTLIARPIEGSKAMNEAVKAMSAFDEAQEQRQKLGRPERREHQAEGEELEAREDDLVEGFGAVKISAFVTVSAPRDDPADLSSQVQRVRAAGTRAGLDLRPVYGRQEQAAAFMTANLPVGRRID